MANKGETKTQKSLSAPRARYFPRKENVFTPKTRPGPHRKSESVPLSFALKYLIGVAKTASEVRKMVLEGSVLVNGAIRNDAGFAVGLFDVIEVVPNKKKYRAIFDMKGRIIMKEIDAKAKDYKISKIVGKKVVGGGKTWLTTNDGFTIELGKETVRVDDSVKIELPALKIAEVYPLESGSTVFIVGGVHVGQTSRIDSVTQGSLQRRKLVALENDENQKFETVTRNVFVVGKNAVEIEALKEK